MKNLSAEAEKFDRYAVTHPTATTLVSDFEKNFYQKYLSKFIGNRVLDIGCGDGRYVDYFASQCEGAQIIPIDISLKRIQRVSLRQHSGAVASADQLPFNNQSFDVVYLMQVIEHVQNPDHVLSECRRVLKKDGYCFVLTPNYPIKRFYDWVEMLRYQKWRKFFDDPTHCSKFSSNSLKNALGKYFSQVDVVPTFVLGEGRSSIIRQWKERKKSSMLFCHKILAAAHP